METKSTTTEQNDAINVSELFYALLAKCWMIIAAMIVCGGLAFAYSKFFISPKYTASCMLFVLNRNSENSLTSSDISASNALLKDYENLAGSHAVIDSVRKDLGLEADPANPDKASYTYEELKNEITVSVPQDSRMLVVSVTDQNANNSKQLADAVSERLVTSIVEIMKTEAVIVDHAVLPKFPSSPNVKKNTIIGAAFGFLLAAAFVVIRFLTDDTIKTDADVEKHLHVPVLGTIPLDESESTKRRRSEYRADMQRAKKLYSGKEGK